MGQSGLQMKGVVLHNHRMKDTEPIGGLLMTKNNSDPGWSDRPPVLGPRDPIDED